MRLLIRILPLLAGLILPLLSLPAEATEVAGATAEAVSSGLQLPAWGWALALFIVCFFLGIVAVLGGVGGGVLFVPIVGGFFFPFHMDFIRGAGLMVALAGALAAGPGLLKSGMANLRLALPAAVIASASAIAGAMMGLALPVWLVQTCLGVTILGIVLLMWLAKKSEMPDVPQADALSSSLRIHGIFFDAARGQEIDWKIHRTIHGLILFVVIGVMAGMFGLGAGWANVPVLNLVMGAPLKVSVATSKFLLSIVDTSAAWVYLNQGAVLAIVTIPSILGIMLGSLIGVRLLAITNAATVRKVVIIMLLIAGLRALSKGLGF
ncbi:MAG: sulfite exporter TauE/SafE family protein [Magnetococcus sp. DMHC-1]|nr:sulfite exporter TauE/SafE family protein [Magnetococcales bacterium]